MAATVSSSPNPEGGEMDAHESSANPSIGGAPAASAVCLVRFAGDSAAGALMGSIYGLGKGLWLRKGFGGAVSEAGSSAKAFAVLSGVHSLVSCFLKRLRGKDDVINAGVAGCCTGFALSFPGAPQALLQSCLTFGAFSFIMEGLNKQQPALANSVHARNEVISSSQKVLPPFTLPVPANLIEDFSSFCQSLIKPKKASCN